MLEAIGRIIKTGRSIAVRVPKDVAKDSAFPFDIGEKVIVQIKNNKLQITKQ